MITIEDIFIELEDVYDPELMVNIVDLGLIYDVEIKGKNVLVKMTLTSPGCPAGDIIKKQVIENLTVFDEIEDVQVEFIWDPPWHPELMTEEAKVELGYAI